MGSRGWQGHVRQQQPQQTEDQDPMCTSGTQNAKVLLPISKHSVDTSKTPRAVSKDEMHQQTRQGALLTSKGLTAGFPHTITAAESSRQLRNLSGKQESDSCYQQAGSCWGQVSSCTPQPTHLDDQLDPVPGVLCIRHTVAEPPCSTPTHQHSTTKQLQERSCWV
jgi:hypothetical protein